MKLINFLIRKQLERAHNKGYDEGVVRGYTLGHKIGQIERGNRFPIKDKYHSEIEDILKESGF